MILRGASDTNTISVNSRTVQRISANVRFKWDGTGSLIGPDLKAVNIKCELSRNGKKTIVFHDNLMILALESMFFHSSECLFPSAFQSMSSFNYIMPLMIDLGAPINLQGTDVLTFEASTNAAWLPANLVTIDSYIDFEWRDAIGVEHALPTIKSKVIQATTAKVSESLGENVTSIGFISTLYGVVIDANAVFTNINITSDRYNINDNLDRMIGRRHSMFENTGTANSKQNCFLYRPETEIDNCQVSVSLNAANVLASTTYIVYRVFETTTHLIQRAADMTDKHATRNKKKFFGRSKTGDVNPT